jgi:hypothetical protein
LLFSADLFGAEARPKLELRSTEIDAILYVNGKAGLRLVDTGVGMGPQQRGRVVLERLQALLDKGISPKSIVAKTVPNGAAVVAPNLRILDVTAEDGDARGLSPLALARSWAASLQALLSQPALGFTVPRLTIPFGQSRSAQIQGVEEGTIEITLTPESLADLRVDTDRRAVVVTAKATGVGVLQAKIGDMVAQIPVEVRKLAGSIYPASVRVTGDGPSAATLRKLMQRAAWSAIRAEPDAKIHMGPFQITKGTPGSVAFAKATLPVSLDGGSYIPVKGTLEVSVQREDVVTGDPEELFYSNNPEMLKKYGPLFLGKLRDGGCTRLLYHHQNVMGRGVEFSVELFNQSNEISRVQVIEGVADPQVDTFQIGHRATAKFLPSYFRNDGYILDLQPGERTLLVQQRLSNNQTASGIFQLRQIAGGTVYVQCRADDPAWKTSPSLPANPRASEEVFPTPQKVINASYEVGGKWAFIGIGKDAIKDAHGNRRLDGNYGVLYDIHLTLSNPKPVAQPVSVLFEPSAGIARGVFVLDNEMIEASHLVPPNEFPIKTYMLKAGESKEVVLKTMPLAGSNYPATIIARVGTTYARR